MKNSPRPPSLVLCAKRKLGILHGQSQPKSAARPLPQFLPLKYTERSLRSPTEAKPSKSVSVFSGKAPQFQCIQWLKYNKKNPTSNIRANPCNPWLKFYTIYTVNPNPNLPHSPIPSAPSPLAFSQKYDTFLKMYDTFPEKYHTLT